MEEEAIEEGWTTVVMGSYRQIERGHSISTWVPRNTQVRTDPPR